MKRLIDLSAIFLTAPVWFPVLSLVYLMVFVRMGSPVLFRQARAGRGGKEFSVVKFRTMTNETGADGKLLPDAERLSPFGKWLRSTSLDELPELLNVLVGEMSLVGPRPLHLRYVDRYSEAQRHRLDVSPGLTGWAQIKGRNSLTWEERFELDVWYIRNQSLWLDFKILWITVWAVLKRDGISAEGESTMTEFMGSDQPDENEDKN